MFDKFCSPFRLNHIWEKARWRRCNLQCVEEFNYCRAGRRYVEESAKDEDKVKLWIFIGDRRWKI